MCGMTLDEGHYYIFCCDNLWKSKCMALEKPGKLGEFFLLLSGHLVFVVLQCKLMPGWGLKKWRSVPSYEPCGLGRTFTLYSVQLIYLKWLWQNFFSYFLATLWCVWCVLLSISLVYNLGFRATVSAARCLVVLPLLHLLLAVVFASRWRNKMKWKWKCLFLTAVYVNQAQKVQNLSSCGTGSCIDTSVSPPRQACTLELCAGIVDKDVSIEEIAREELLEEVGYDVPISALEKIVSSRYSSFVSVQRIPHFYLRQVNKVNGGDNVFVRYVSVCVCVCSGSVNQTNLQRLKLRTSNLTCMFPGTVWTWLLKNFSKRAWSWSCDS